MFPDEFTYHRAESVEEAVDLLASHPEAELLAGGHSLLPTMKSRLARPTHVVDIGAIDALRGIERDGETVSVGALTTYADVVASEAVQENASVVVETARAIGDVQVRNRGTVGGNVAHADPASDLPAAMLSADATLVARGPEGSRRIPVDDFFLGMYETALAEDELLTRIELPARPDAVGAYAKRPSPASGYAVVGVAVALSLDDGTVDTVRVAANGVADHGIRLPSVEAALDGTRLSDETIEAAAGHAADDLEGAVRMDDHQASSAFREHLLGVFTKRALTAATARAGMPAPSA